eukprot:gnl/Chilomastix_cuspidata/4854.p3 GENE.gnl/Chilomastix_cuspidata/4854~~gnl/Chilomastix_cuspidata/4854.p3  ORF type:complete len:366 (+),score=211.17 gnl/Chilomastix_cuspidata/4854:110-1207(+)
MRCELPDVPALVAALRSHETDARLRAVDNLVPIALALGPRRTREELLRFLKDKMLLDTAEVCTRIARALPDLRPLIGGPDFYYILLAPLETLAGSDSDDVRAAAIASILALTEFLDVPSFAQMFEKVTENLLAAHWYNCRLSGIALLPTFLRNAGRDTRAAMIARLIRAADEHATPVRTEVARAFGRIIEHIPADELIPDMTTFVLNLSGDKCAATRIANIANLIRLVDLLETVAERPRDDGEGVGKLREKLFKQLLSHSVDAIWRARSEVASRLPAIARVAAGTDFLPLEKCLALFRRLASEKEEDVRTVAVRALPAFVESLLAHQLRRVRGGAAEQVFRNRRGNVGQGGDAQQLRRLDDASVG